MKSKAYTLSGTTLLIGLLAMLLAFMTLLKPQDLNSNCAYGELVLSDSSRRCLTQNEDAWFRYDACTLSYTDVQAGWDACEPILEELYTSTDEWGVCDNSGLFPHGYTDYKPCGWTPEEYEEAVEELTQ